MRHLPFFGGKTKNHRDPDTGKSQILRQTIQSVFPEANAWRADYSQTFVCNNNQDNIPIETTLTKKEEKFTFVISQNRGVHKTIGQDCMAIAKHGEYEVIVLSDGHDEEGHLVSQGVCGILPSIILRLIHERPKKEINDPIPDDLLYDAFDECEQVVCWAQGEADKGGYVRIAAGEYEGVAGYCTGFDEEHNAIVSVVEEFEVEGEDEVEVGYLEIVVSPEDILVPRFSGGGTCVVLIRHVRTNSCRIAFAGDSRVMIYLPSHYSPTHINDPSFLPTYGNKICPKTKKPYSAFLSPQHNVFNTDEKQRLDADYSDLFTISGAFLVNPDTNFMIQPTRGFGDHDMHGTGYTHIPQLSGTFNLPKDALVIAASDGVFDDNVWSDREIVDRIGELYENENQTANQIAKVLYEETLSRSENSGYVDDISLVAYRAPELKHLKKSNSNNSKRSLSKDVKIKRSKSLEKKVSMKTMEKNRDLAKESRRNTLKRGGVPIVLESILKSGEGASFDEIENNFETIKKQKSMNLEDKRSQKTLVKGIKNGISQKKLKQKLEVKARVTKGGKTYTKTVGGKKIGSTPIADILDPNAKLDF